MSSEFQFKLTIFVTLFVNLVSPCLITNCPRGGKRDGSENNLIEANAVQPAIKSCTPCGPNGQGVCIGRDICCGKHIGCLIANPYTRICRRVREFPESCLSSFSSCGNEGSCVARNVCCSRRDCRIDDSCKTIPYADAGNRFGNDILNRLSSYSLGYPVEMQKNLANLDLSPFEEILATKEDLIVPSYNYKVEES